MLTVHTILILIIKYYTLKKRQVITIISRLFFLDFSASSMCSVSSQTDESRPHSPCRDELNKSNVPSAVAAALPPQNATSADGAVESAAAVAQNQCFTVCQPLKLRQEWTISNFANSLDLATPGFCMRSKNFRHESMPEIRWQLSLYPGGKREENRGNVSLFLKMSTMMQHSELFSVRTKYHFHFVDEKGVPIFNNMNFCDFKLKPSKLAHSWGLRNIPREIVKNSIWIDQSLHIICYVELLVPRELGGSKVEQLQQHQCSAGIVASNCPECVQSTRKRKASGVGFEIGKTDAGRFDLTNLSSNVGAAAISGDDEGHVCGQCGQRVPNKNSIL